MPATWNPSWPRPTHYLGDSADFHRCEPAHARYNPVTAFPLTNALSTTGALSVMANPLPMGKESTTAPAVNFGSGLTGWVIPPATSSSAGAVAVYAMVTTPARASGGIAAANFPLAGTGAQTFRAGWFYKWSANDAQLACTVCRGVACLTYHADYFNQGWQAYYFDRSLDAMRVAYLGALSVSTHADLDSSNSTISSSWSNIPFNYTFSQ